MSARYDIAARMQRDPDFKAAIGEIAAGTWDGTLPELGGAKGLDVDDVLHGCKGCGEEVKPARAVGVRGGDGPWCCPECLSSDIIVIEANRDLISQVFDLLRARDHAD